MVLTIGPVSAEAVPAKLMSTASGLVVGISEVFGGGIAASLAGFGDKHFGIGSTLYMPIGALCCGLMAVAFLKETAPHRVHYQSQSRLTTRTGPANSLKEGRQELSHQQGVPVRVVTLSWMLKLQSGREQKAVRLSPGCRDVCGLRS